MRVGVAVLVAFSLLAALVIFVERQSSGPAATERAAAAAQANREGEIVVAQDQAPHSVALRLGSSPAVALERVLRAEMAFRIAHGALQGPMGSAACFQFGVRGGRRGFSCTVEAAGVSYPFRGVVDSRSRSITYCKRDPPPVPALNVPVSARCRL